MYEPTRVYSKFPAISVKPYVNLRWNGNLSLANIAWAASTLWSVFELISMILPVKHRVYFSSERCCASFAKLMYVKIVSTAARPSVHILRLSWWSDTNQAMQIKPTWSPHDRIDWPATCFDNQVIIGIPLHWVDCEPRYFSASNAGSNVSAASWRTKTGISSIGVFAEIVWPPGTTSPVCTLIQLVPAGR